LATITPLLDVVPRFQGSFIPFGKRLQGFRAGTQTASS